MIRKAIPSEIDSIMSLTRACAKKMIAEGILQWNEHYPDRNSFLSDIERSELFVFISEETPIACIVISSHKDEVYNSVKWLTSDKGNYYIHRLAVHPDHQHKGLARKLMDFAETYVRERKGVSIRLDTFSKNPRNQKFYEARGYQRLDDVYFPKQSNHPFYCYELLISPAIESM